MRTGWQRGARLAALVSSLAAGAQAAPGPDASLARLAEVDRQLHSAPQPGPDSWEIAAPLAELHARWIDAFTAWLDRRLNARDPDPRPAVSAELLHAGLAAPQAARTQADGNARAPDEGRPLGSLCDLRVTRREPFLVVEVDLAMGWACDRVLLVYQVEAGCGVWPA